MCINDKVLQFHFVFKRAKWIQRYVTLLRCYQKLWKIAFYTSFLWRKIVSAAVRCPKILNGAKYD